MMRTLTPALANYLLCATKVREIEEQIQERVARLDFNKSWEELREEVLAIERELGYEEALEKLEEAKKPLKKLSVA